MDFTDEHGSDLCLSVNLRLKKSLQPDALFDIHAAHKIENTWSLKGGPPAQALGGAPLGSKPFKEERVNGKDGL
jgi:hypothetical protein